MANPWVMETIVWNIIQIQHGSEELWPGHRFLVCVQCDLDIRDMTLGQDYDTSLGHGQRLCEILSRSNMTLRSYGLDSDSGYVFTVTLTLEIWPWIKVMTHPLGHGQQLCEILSISNMAMRSYGPDMDFQYVFTVTLTLEVWPWVKVMTHPWVMDNNCMKVLQIQHGSEELWPGHRFWVCVHCDLDLGDMTFG